MIAIRKRPGERPEIVEIENELSALQKEVGGYIQAVPLAEDACIVCDEDGRLKGYAPNCEICGVSFVGTILVVGVDGPELCDLADAEEARNRLFPTRMTRRMDNGVLVRKDLDFHIDEDDYDLIQSILARLAAYEDTGLEPEEVDDRVWREAEVELPADPDELVLAIVSGRPRRNIELVNAYELASFVGGEGWVLESYPEWENPIVTHWMPLPELPKEEEV